MEDEFQQDGYPQIDASDSGDSLSLTGNLMDMLVPPSFCQDCLIHHPTSVLCKYAINGRQLKNLAKCPAAAGT